MVTDPMDLAAEGRGRYRPMSTKTSDLPADVPSACRDCICSAALCLPVHRADPGASARLAHENAAGARTTHGDGGAAGDGAERGAALRALSSGAESGALVVTPRGADSAGAVARDGAGAGADRGGGRRDAGTAQGRAHSGEGDVSRCGALLAQQGGDLFGAGVDLHGGVGAPAVERAALGAALSHPLGAVETGRRGGRAAPSHGRGADHRDGLAGLALAAATTLDPAWRRQLLLHPTGVGRAGCASNPGHASAPGRTPVSLSRTGARRAARPQAEERRRTGQARHTRGGGAHPRRGGRDSMVRTAQNAAPAQRGVSVAHRGMAAVADSLGARGRLNMAPARVVELFVQRWSLEVTFEEVRRHLGGETPRQWTDLAIARTTPMLMALFSLVCLMVYRWRERWDALPRSTAWYLNSSDE